MYRNRPGCKIGYVKPGAEILYPEGPREYVSSDRPEKATLKAIALDRVKNLDAESSIVLLSGRPRQGTFCEWHRDSGLVKAFVENEPWEPSVKRLSVAQQEVLCSEVMRTIEWADFELPQLESLLLPVGRTLKDIDIYGLSVDGKMIVAQVTNYQYCSVQAERKLKRLQSFGTPTAKVLFCDTAEILYNGDVVIFPLEEAFRLFKETTVGERWLGAGLRPISSPAHRRTDSTASAISVENRSARLS